jgi:hypothetical protein
MLPEGARRISHTQDVFLQEPAHLARDRHHSRQAGAASIQAGQETFDMWQGMKVTNYMQNHTFGIRKVADQTQVISRALAAPVRQRG